jgi:hypothetical protein
MTPGQLREKGKRYNDWSNELAPIVGYAPDTVRHWSQKCATIPERAAAAFRAWEAQRNISRQASQWSFASVFLVFPKQYPH